MRSWIHRHPALVTLAMALFAMAATGAFIYYYLGSWLILPLI
jgi:phage shock protein PspC (stress-responsive transcriptional regulator)